MKLTSVAVPLLAGVVTASPAVEPRQSCPKVHVFGARETTVPQGYGTSQGLVDQVVRAYPGATKEAIVYPACGGQSNCGGASYDSSQSQGTAAVVRQVTAFNQKCPNTAIVVVGYSQGGQIFDNALCGGAGQTLSGAALKAVKAAIFMGDPRNNNGLPYNVGTCRNKGFAARPNGFQCSPADPSIIQSYCDSTDPYCCNGNDANSHQQYVNKYGSQALTFIKKLVDAALAASPTASNVKRAPPPPPTKPPTPTTTTKPTVISAETTFPGIETTFVFPTTSKETRPRGTGAAKV